jgi:hypothetical protein
LLNATPSASTPLNRLVYRAAPAAEAVTSDVHAPGYTKTIMFELVIPEMSVEAYKEELLPEMDMQQIECRIGEENVVDVLMPDRCDLPFSTTAK